jgi:hypothetical protein
MWTPNQLLNEQTVKTLREGGFADLEIEFLGWLSYNANALNNSRNPVKAAHTLLAKESTEKMFEKFALKKKESVRPKEREEHDGVSRKFRQLEKWIQQVEDEVVIDREVPWDS